MNIPDQIIRVLPDINANCERCEHFKTGNTSAFPQYEPDGQFNYCGIDKLKLTNTKWQSCSKFKETS